MPTVEEYKLAFLWQLTRLKAEEREPVLELPASPSDVAIRAIAELEADRIMIFDDNSIVCRLTSHGSRIADRLIEELAIKQKLK